jgi:hypothetical protein
MTYIELVPAVLLAAALLFAPGWLALRGLGLAGAVAFVWAPGPSLALIVLGGAITRVLHLRVGGPAGIAVMTVVVAGAVVAARLAGSRRAVEPATVALPKAATVALTLGPTFAVVAFMLARAFRSPLGWAQMPDNIFHVGAVTWMVRHGSAWIGDASQYSPPANPPVTYPGVWHAMTSLVATWTSLPALPASNALVMVVAGLVWPSSMLALAWQVVDTTKVTTVTVVGTSLAFFAMPYQPIAWGVLWPYLLGLSLLPAVLAALTAVGWPPQSGGVLPHAVIPLVTTGGVAALAHPSLVFSAALLGVPIVVASLASRGRRRLAALAGAFAVMCAASVWLLRPTKMFDLRKERDAITAGQALDLVVGTFSPLKVLGLLLLTLTAAGLAVGCRPVARWWLWWGVSVPLVVTAVAWTFPGALSRMVTWPWWNDVPRIRALVVIPATLAITLLVLWARERAGVSLGGRRANMWCAAVLVTFAGLSLVVGTTAVQASYFPEKPEEWWASPADRNSLAALADFVPAGATVAANPYRGSTHMYLARDITLLFPTEWIITEHPDRRLVGQYLDEMTKQPDVCRAVLANHVSYAVTGGTPHAWGESSLSHYAGVERVAGNPSFTRVAMAGPYALWRLPSCQS